MSDKDFLKGVGYVLLSLGLVIFAFVFIISRIIEGVCK